MWLNIVAMLTRETKNLAVVLLAAIVCFGSLACTSSGGLLGPADETKEAIALIQDANTDLKAIKVLYNKHLDKREDLKNAMQADDAATVKKLSDEVVDIINEGTASGKRALDKIDQARELKVNEDYAEYLGLKWQALNSQIEAFEQYRQAARKLRDKYDPKNTQVRDEVVADFKNRSEDFQKLMERARDYSSQANELAKEVARRSKE